MLLSAPLEVARTNAITFAPMWWSASVRCEPMKPSAPVTTTVRPPYTSPNSARSASSVPSLQTVSASLIRRRLLPRVMDSSGSPRSAKGAVVLRAGAAGAGRASARAARPRPRRRLRQRRRRPRDPAARRVARRASSPSRRPPRRRAPLRRRPRRRGRGAAGRRAGAVRHDPPLRRAGARRAARRASATARRGRGTGRAPSRLGAECAPLVARSRPRPPRHLRLYRMGSPRRDASAVVHARRPRRVLERTGWRVDGRRTRR